MFRLVRFPFVLCLLLLTAGIARQTAGEEQADAVTAGSAGPLPVSLSLRSGWGFPLDVDGDDLFEFSAPGELWGSVQPFAGLPLTLGGAFRYTHLETEPPEEGSGFPIIALGGRAGYAAPIAPALSAVATASGGPYMAGGLGSGWEPAGFSGWVAGGLGIRYAVIPAFSLSLGGEYVSYLGLYQDVAVTLDATYHTEITSAPERTGAGEVRPQPLEGSRWALPFSVGVGGMYMVPAFQRMEVPDFAPNPTFNGELGFVPVAEWPLELRAGYTYSVINDRQDGGESSSVSAGTVGATWFWTPLAPISLLAGIGTFVSYVSTPGDSSGEGFWFPAVVANAGLRYQVLPSWSIDAALEYYDAIMMGWLGGSIGTTYHFAFSEEAYAELGTEAGPVQVQPLQGQRWALPFSARVSGTYTTPGRPDEGFDRFSSPGVRATFGAIPFASWPLEVSVAFRASGTISTAELTVGQKRFRWMRISTARILALA